MAESGPKVEQHFEGNCIDEFLTRTAESRVEVRKALIALQEAFSQIAGEPTQLKADIRLSTIQTRDRADVYTVTITDSASKVSALPPPRTGDVFVHSPLSIGQGGGRQAPARRSVDARDTAETTQPSKRPRIGQSDGSLASGDPRARPKSSVDEALTFMKNWHREWTQQGGWLYDTLNRTNTKSDQDNVTIENRLGATQEVLGQSINAANASAVSEFEKVKSLIKWLEDCRKVSASKVQAREEKWRSSSATFHDQSRRDRETAERRIEDKMDAQTQLLVKFAKASGINLDGSDDSEEGSLGAQLTAELNLEVAQGEKNHDQTFMTIHDEDDDG